MRKDTTNRLPAHLAGADALNVHREAADEDREWARSIIDWAVEQSGILRNDDARCVLLALVNNRAAAAPHRFTPETRDALDLLSEIGELLGQGRTLADARKKIEARKPAGPVPYAETPEVKTAHSHIGRMPNLLTHKESRLLYAHAEAVGQRIADLIDKLKEDHPVRRVLEEYMRGFAYSVTKPRVIRAAFGAICANISRPPFVPDFFSAQSAHDVRLPLYEIIGDDEGAALRAARRLLRALDRKKGARKRPAKKSAKK